MRIITLLAALLIICSAKSQDTIALWSFPTGTESDSLADVANTLNQDFILTTVGGTSKIDYTKNGITSKSALTDGWEDGNGNKYWQVIVNTKHYEEITISSAQQNGISYPGPRDWKIQYKVNNQGIWTDAGAEFVTTNSWSTSTVSELPLPAECAEVDSLFFRWIMTSDTASSDTALVDTTGRTKIDNIRIMGTPLFTDFLITTTQSIILCDNDSILIGANYFSAPQTLYDTLIYPFGNDTVFITELIASESVSTENNVSITICESYFAGGQEQTVSGTYTDTLQTSLGCDSIVVTYLEVTNPFPYTDTVYVYDTITVYDSIAVSDTLIIDVLIDGMPVPDNHSIISVYPNPAHDFLSVDFENYTDLAGYSFKIVNTTGQIISEEIIDMPHYDIEINTFGAYGLYYFQVINSIGVVTEVRKIILE